MSDDTPWINAVVAAQKSGREINCHTPGPGTVAELSASYAKQTGLTHAPSESIVQPLAN
jgi:hypothetical protein